MANIQIQRGQQQQVDVTYKLAGVATALDLSSGYDAELVIRRRRGDSYMGQVIDTLRFGGTSGTAIPEADSRITFTYASAGPNIQLKWNTAQATLLPNEAITVYGDLKITLNSSSEIVHHVRLTFDILPEITA
tara:strand:- start:252 stop:650 length:399 start_codon:yes stop_codon:yes gene_type:complete